MERIKIWRFWFCYTRSCHVASKNLFVLSSFQYDERYKWQSRLCIAVVTITRAADSCRQCCRNKFEYSKLRLCKPHGTFRGNKNQISRLCDEGEIWQLHWEFSGNHLPRETWWLQISTIRQLWLTSRVIIWSFYSEIISIKSYLRYRDNIFVPWHDPSVFTKFKFLPSPARWNLCVSDLCVLLNGTYGQTFVIQAIKCWSMRSARRNAWKHVTFRKYVAATRNSPGYVVLNHRPRRNARTYTPPGSGGTFLRKVSRKARSLFRKTSSNVPRRLEVALPPIPSSFCRPPPRQTWNSRRDFDEIPCGLWTTVLGPTMASNLHPGRQCRYLNLFRLSCKLAGMSEVNGNSESNELNAIWLTISTDNESCITEQKINAKVHYRRLL